MSQNFGYIYEATTTSFIRRGWRKIGFTNNLKRRLKDLASQSGSPEEYVSFNWYRVESSDKAKQIEKYVHAELTALGLRVHERREFFAYPRNFFIRDIVNEASDKLEIKVLSNTQLEIAENNFDLGVLLPCRFFLLSTEETFQNFRIWGERSLSTSITLIGYDNDLFKSRLFRFFDKPDWNFSDYLRDFDKEPYLLARMKSSGEAEIKAIRNKLATSIKEEIEDYFQYNSEWRRSLGELKEPGYHPNYKSSLPHQKIRIS